MKTYYKTKTYKGVPVKQDMYFCFQYFHIGKYRFWYHGIVDIDILGSFGYNSYRNNLTTNQFWEFMKNENFI